MSNADSLILPPVQNAPPAREQPSQQGACMSDAQYAAYLAGGYRRNMVVNIADVATYQFALSMVSMAVVFPAMLLRLGASQAVVALLPAIVILGCRLPQIATSYYAETRIRQKPWIVACGFVQRLPWLALPVALWLWAEPWPAGAVAAAIACVAISFGAIGLAGPSWGELIAKAIPPRRRGLFMGVVNMLGNAMGLAGGVVVVVVMKGDRVVFPHNYALLATLCFIMACVSFVFFCLNREPVLDHGVVHRDWRTYAASMLDVLRTDRPFRWFLLFVSLAYVLVVGQGLFMAHAIGTFGLADAITGDFVIASAATVLVASPLLGHLADRHGHRLVLGLATGAYVLSAALAAAAWDWRVLYAVFGLLALSMSGQMISTFNMVYQFAPRGRRPTYLALAAAGPMPFVLLFALSAGPIARWVGLPALFAASAVVSLAALVVLVWAVRPPQVQTIQEG